MKTVFLAIEGLHGGDLEQLPTLARLAEEGSVSDLAAPLAGSRVAALATAMTGSWADQHEVLLAAMPLPDGSGARPVEAADRRKPAVWETLDAQGLPCVAVGWPAAAGWEMRTEGSAVVDARFGIAGAAEAGRWVHAKGRNEAVLQECRMGPDELDLAALGELVPEWEKVEQMRDPRLAILAGVVSDSVSRHAAFLELLEAGEWSFATLALALPAELARLEEGSAKTAEGWIFDGLRGRGMKLVDAFLQAILAVLPEAGVRLMVAGIGDAEAAIPSPALPPAASGKKERGFVILQGPGVAKGAKASGAHPLDLAPTAWRLYGWSPVAGCAGRPLVEVMEDYPLLRSFDRAWSPAARMPLAENPDGGGIAKTNPAWPVHWHMVALRMRVECLRARQEWDEAVARQEERWALQPDSLLLLTELVECRYFARRYAEALDDARDLMTLADPEDPLPVLMVAGLEAICGDLPKGRRLLDEAAPLVKARPAARLFQGRVLIHLRQWREAKEVLLALVGDEPENGIAWEQLSRAYVALNAGQDACDAALRATGLNLHDAVAHEALGEALLLLGLRDEAKTAFRAAMEIAPGWKVPSEKVKALSAETRG